MPLQPTEEELKTMRTKEYQLWRLTEVFKDVSIAFAVLLSGLIGANAANNVLFITKDLSGIFLMVALTAIFAAPISLVFTTGKYRQHRLEVWNIREGV